MKKISEEITNLKTIIIGKEKIVNEEKKKIEELLNNLKNNSKKDIQKFKELIKQFEINENLINEFKKPNISLLLKSGERMINLIFISFNEDIYYSVLCKTLIFFQL